MDSQRIYDQIIDRAKNRKKPECYCELHHIVPKSLGGSDDSENLVYLTAREHFIAHWLLKKIHQNQQMVYAFFAMTKPVGNGRTRYTSHSFKYARESMAKLMSEKMKGNNHPFFGMKKELNPNYGSKRSDETRRKIAEKTENRLKKHHPNAKKVYCVETGVVYKSTKDAQRNHSGNVAYSLRTGGKAGGFTFAYVGMQPAEFHYSWSSGANRFNAVAVFDEFGNRYETLKQAGMSIGVTGAAIQTAIKRNKKCKGVMFKYD